MLKKFILRLILAYQRHFSPDHSASGKTRYPFGYCKFTPSCSEYAYKAVEKHGIVFGLAKALWRILRCNPCGRGGYDPV